MNLTDVDIDVREWASYRKNSVCFVSPNNFNSANANANVWYVNSTGQFNANGTTNAIGVRPISYYK